MAQSEQRVTPLELFFDLVLVYAITQVTELMSHDPTWRGRRPRAARARRTLVGVDGLRLAHEHARARGGSRSARACSERWPRCSSSPSPSLEAFGADAVLFGVAYLLVRLLNMHARTPSPPSGTPTCVGPSCASRRRPRSDP